MEIANGSFFTTRFYRTPLEAPPANVETAAPFGATVSIDDLAAALNVVDISGKDGSVTVRGIVHHNQEVLGPRIVVGGQYRGVGTFGAREALTRSMQAGAS